MKLLNSLCISLDYICIMILGLRVGYLICISLHGDLVNHHTSSTLNVEESGLVFRSNQVS